METFSGQVALVTGATSGIGKATALAFARARARVVLAGRNVRAGEMLSEEIRGMGGEAIFVPTDVAQEAQVQRLLERTEAAFGRLDCAFNNAGIEGEKFVPITEQTESNYHQVMDINVMGVLWCLKHEIKLMMSRRSGAIVNNASVAGILGFPTMSVYSASKHAVIGLTKSAALEVANQGIRVNAVSPGGVASAMSERFKVAGSDPEAFAAMHPMGRIGEPEEIAAAVLFLCSPASSFMVGANLVVDGGFSVP